MRSLKRFALVIVSILLIGVAILFVLSMLGPRAIPPCTDDSSTGCFRVITSVPPNQRSGLALYVQNVQLGSDAIALISVCVKGLKQLPEKIK